MKEQEDSDKFQRVVYFENKLILLLDRIENSGERERKRLLLVLGVLGMGCLGYSPIEIFSRQMEVCIWCSGDKLGMERERFWIN